MATRDKESVVMEGDVKSASPPLVGFNLGVTLGVVPIEISDGSKDVKENCGESVGEGGRSGCFDGGDGGRDMEDQELLGAEMEELLDGCCSLLEIPDMYSSCKGQDSMGISGGVPPRTIPFRSASFSQVDITSDGKYVRNPRSLINLKPTAFCLLNSSNPSNRLVSQSNNVGSNNVNNVPNSQTPPAYTPTPPTPTTSISREEEANGSQSGAEGVETTAEGAGGESQSPPSHPALSEYLPLEHVGELAHSNPSQPLKESHGQNPQVDELKEEVCQMQEGDVVKGGTADLNSGESDPRSSPLVAAKADASGLKKSEEIKIGEGKKGGSKSLDEEQQEDGCISKDGVQFYLGSDPDLYPANGGESREFQLSVQILENNGNEIKEVKNDMEVGGREEVCDKKGEEGLEEKEGRKEVRKDHVEGGEGEMRDSLENNVRGKISPPPNPSSILNEIESKLLLGFKMNHHRHRLQEQRISYGDGSSGGSLELDEEKNQLVRQYSGQSDCSDDVLSPGHSSSFLPPRGLQTSAGLSGTHPNLNTNENNSGRKEHDSESSYPPLPTGGNRSSNNSSDDSATIDLNPAAPVPQHCSSQNTPAPPPRSGQCCVGLSSNNRGHLVRSSPVSGSVPPFTPVKALSQGSSTESGGGGTLPKKEISRANSVSCPPAPNPTPTQSLSPTDSNYRPLPPRRYNKRPLRGPYGEMLEAEMNKLVPGRQLRDYYESQDFCRESKSSSPNRTTNSHSSNTRSHDDNDHNHQLHHRPELSSQNPLFMGSLDDLQFTHNQPSPTVKARTRKISSQLPAQASHFPGETVASLAFHQRTASSPSQLLYTSTPKEPSGQSQEPVTRRRYLDGSPRGHVLAEIVETEKSYVDSLRILVKKYMEPLKSSDFIDDGLVDEIFFQIPKILWHHEHLLEALQSRVTDDMQCVGDVLLETFRQNSLLECYSLFVNNWKNAKGSLKMAVASKPPLARFLEDNARQHKGKLTLDSLLIMPIQRIPRYELLVKELLKHTNHIHEDYPRLNLVLDNIKQFALHIDCASVDPNDNREIEIEGWGSGLGHLVRQDIVTLCTSSNGKKEKALFLFADCLVIASIKRKSTMRKTSASASHSSGTSWEGCKFKLLMKIPLMDAHLLHDDHESGSKSGGSGGGSSSFGGKSLSGLGVSYNSHEDTDDLKIIQKMMELATMLKCSHVGLDEILKDLATGVKHHSDNGDAIDIEIKSNDNSDNPEVLKILFGTVEKKCGWLDSFHDTLNKFIRYGFGKMPQVQFLQALPIRKTRAGLQLSCAASVSLHNKVSKTVEMSDVWVANSDGYVGQICILTLHPEPSITSCNGVCNSRITCIISVPPPSPPQSGSLHTSATAPHHHHNDHHHHPQHHSTASHPQIHSLGYESEDDSHRNRSGHKATTEHWSVWLGTEDGGLHVYDCSDSVRVKKNRHKVQHNSPLHSIVYFDNRVFVSLGNGDLAVYSRHTSGKGWSISDPSWVTIGSALNPVTKMICVRNQIWCACGSQMKVYGESGSGALELVQTIPVTSEAGGTVARGISNMIPSEEHVWVSLQGTSVLRCYNNLTFECLYETNVAPNVYKILAGCDDIIRQHKSACLRITALLVAPDKSLWVGTSAGVILTVASAAHSYKITPLCHGHTGQVRFLTYCTNRDNSTVISGGDGFEEFRPHTSPFHASNHNNNNSGSSFGSMMSSLMGESSVDISGREDSTNHLLIWKIPKSA